MYEIQYLYSNYILGSGWMKLQFKCHSLCRWAETVSDAEIDLWRKQEVERPKTSTSPSPLHFLSVNWTTAGRRKNEEMRETVFLLLFVLFIMEISKFVTWTLNIFTSCCWWKQNNEEEPKQRWRLSAALRLLQRRQASVELAWLAAVSMCTHLHHHITSTRNETQLRLH